MTKIDQFISVAEGFRDCHTGDNRHLQIVRFYNQISPLPRSYKLQPGDAWCAAFISAVGYILGMVPDVIRPECGAHEMFRAYPAAQREGDPERGDLVFYDWNGDGRIDHVGVCTFISSGSMQILEGNKDGGVGYRYIKADDPAIYGFVRPAWGADEGKALLYVDCDTLNLRKNPSMTADVLLELPYQSAVEVAGPEADGWACVSYEGMTGYCGEGYLTDVCPPSTGITTTALYLRHDPGTDSKIIKVLPSGTSFYYTGDRSLIGSVIWERIYISDDLAGWISTKYARPLE